MSQLQKICLFLLRISLGVLFFYAGITKILNPEWTAAGYLADPAMFKGFYAWLASESVLPIVDMLNKWGLTLIGTALILGAFVRTASILGAAMMALYYFPILNFPYPNEHSYIVDDHIVYALALLVLAAFHAGRVWGLEHKYWGLRK